MNNVPMSDKPPFQKGDLLCLEGPNVYNGRHVHRAYHEPVKHGAFWCHGWRPWGRNRQVPGGSPKIGGDCYLRHATVSDVHYLLEKELDTLERTAKQIKTLREYMKELEI